MAQCRAWRKPYNNQICSRGEEEEEDWEQDKEMGKEDWDELEEGEGGLRRGRQTDHENGKDNKEHEEAQIEEHLEIFGTDFLDFEDGRDGNNNNAEDQKRRRKKYRKRGGVGMDSDEEVC